MAKCKRCSLKESLIYIPQYRLRVCEDCFIELFHRRILETIKLYRMFDKNHKILIAVSGGKDSLSLWDTLSKQGFYVLGLHIDLGIGDYSEISKEKVQKFAKDRNLEYKLISLKEILGATLQRIIHLDNREPCQICGIIKRYIMNKEATGFDVVVTGHNLDDEAAFLLKNLLFWERGALSHQKPTLSKQDGFVKKAKPLCLTPEKNVLLYANLNQIDYVKATCPLSKGSNLAFFKKIMDELEKKMPAIKISFYKEFVKYNFFKEENKSSPTPCKICSYPTNVEICRFCRLKEKIKIK